MKHFASVIIVAFISSAACAAEDGFGDKRYGDHFTCAVHVNQAGTELTVRKPGVIAALSVAAYGSIWPNDQVYPGMNDQDQPWLVMQDYANQWLHEQGFPSLQTLFENPYACSNLS